MLQNQEVVKFFNWRVKVRILNWTVEDLEPIKMNTVAMKLESKYKGIKINKLTMIRIAGIPKHTKQRLHYWECQCDCGKIVYLCGTRLISNTYYSCGCVKLPRNNRRKLDLIGKKFGKLTVVEKINPDKLHWRCICECGKEVEKSTSTLFSSPSVSCGCNTKHHNYKGFGVSGFNAIISRYRKSADARDLAFTLTETQFREIIFRECYYCGTQQSSEFKLRTKFQIGSIKYNGIDRIDNSKGYTIDNVVTCCTMCNKMKLTFGITEFKEKILQIASRISSGLL